MKIDELLVKEREDYLSVMMDSFREYQRKLPPAAVEVLLEVNESPKPAPYRFCRIDIICGGPDKPQLVDVNKDRYYAITPYEFTLSMESEEKVLGRLSPFYWNGMEFRLFGKINSWTSFERWVHYWMDIGDARYDKDKELSNVIHNVSMPEDKGDFFQVSIDMGSAEVKAFFELLALFPEMGVTKFDVGSFSMIDSSKDQE